MKRRPNLKSVAVGGLIVACIHVVFVLLLCTGSCQHTTNEFGIPLILQHRYWNYYERGIAYTLVKEWEKAAEDFKVAMGEKEGALYPEPTEMRRNKTYGVRFIEDYFPHRELGICHFFNGNLDDAEKELITSIQMLPSVRAKFYLNKVRRAKIAQVADPKKNNITIQTEYYDSPIILKSHHFDLAATITSPNKIHEILINGERELIELAKEKFEVKKRVFLLPGRQKILITVEDLGGKE